MKYFILIICVFTLISFKGVSQSKTDSLISYYTLSKDSLKNDSNTFCAKDSAYISMHDYLLNNPAIFDHDVPNNQVVANKVYQMIFGRRRDNKFIPCNLRVLTHLKLSNRYAFNILTGIITADVRDNTFECKNWKYLEFLVKKSDYPAPQIILDAIEKMKDK